MQGLVRTFVVHMQQISIFLDESNSCMILEEIKDEQMKLPTVETLARMANQLDMDPVQ